MNRDHFERLSSYIPLDLLNTRNAVLAIAVILLFILARYFAFVSIGYVLFWKRKMLGPRYLHDQELKPAQIAYEIKWSVVSSVIFALAGFAIGVAWQNGWTQIYLTFDHFGLWYLPVSFLLLGLVHEVYFYGTHVLMHRPAIYRRIHATHHFSRKPSPWASFSFHPGEAVVQALFLPLAVLVIPVHPTVLLAYLTFMTLTAISNHLGVEIIRSETLRRWFISGEHHAFHHQRFDCNYGLYFCFMDRIFGTHHRARSGDV